MQDGVSEQVKSNVICSHVLKSCICRGYNVTSSTFLVVFYSIFVQTYVVLTTISLTMNSYHLFFYHISQIWLRWLACKRDLRTISHYFARVSMSVGAFITWLGLAKLTVSQLRGLHSFSTLYKFPKKI